MKKFILKTLLFFILIFIGDLSLGPIVKLYNNARAGEVGKISTIMTKIKPELLIIGSSRAHHHYDSNLLSDSLNLRTFNAGIDGQGTTLSYAFLKGISQREMPEYVICDILPQFDLYDSERNVSTNFLYPYLDIPGVKQIIFDFDPNDKYKLFSNAYKLNSDIPGLAVSILREPKLNNGYTPLTGSITIGEEKNELKEYETINYLKRKYLEQLIEFTQTHNCKLVFAISPTYKGDDIAKFKEEIDIIKKYVIPILDHLNDKRLIDNPSYFNDSFHMNNEGAKVYSKIILEDLKSTYPELNN